MCVCVCVCEGVCVCGCVGVCPRAGFVSGTRIETGGLWAGFDFFCPDFFFSFNFVFFFH